jgi:methionine-S-sulfoxide reductase
VGYAGGASKNPTYYDLGGHSESVQVDFDPSRVTYEALVEAFFSFHDATLPPYSRQYMSAIFADDAEQERIAGEVMQRVQQRSKGTIKTLILPLEGFYPAEDYHQKYALQGDDLLLAEFQKIYPALADLVNSTAVMRVNAYLYGEGAADQLQAEIGSLGLSAAAQAHLQSASPVGACPVAP